LLSETLAAQRRPLSFEELGDVLRTGETVVVIDADGHQTRGEVASVSSSEIVVQHDQATMRFPAQEVAWIEVPAKRRAWRKGLWIGAAVGALGGFAVGEGSYPGFALLGALGAGVGTAIGLLIDLSRPSRMVIYSAAAASR
jgi:hypothetical protein